MPVDPQLNVTNRAMVWGGRVLSALIVPPMVMGAIMSFRLPPDIAKNFEAMGWPTSVAATIGVLNLASLALFLVPQTAVLGAILLTGYFGGAVATHLRVGEDAKCIVPVVFGVIVWLGIFLREPRLRAILPWRTNQSL